MVPVQIEGCPVPEKDNETADVHKQQPITATNIQSKANGILVSIHTRDGLHVRRGNLDYVGLMELVKKLEGLC